jgi:hypothetical protein
LKDWDPSWYTETGQAMKYLHRERIATEFIDEYVNNTVYRLSLMPLSDSTAMQQPFVQPIQIILEGSRHCPKPFSLNINEPAKAKVRAKRREASSS